jgi:hypothetical protein
VHLLLPKQGPWVTVGYDPHDPTSSRREVPDYAEGLLPAEGLLSRPLEGLRAGVIRETLGEGVSAGVADAVKGAIRHLEALGADVSEVRNPRDVTGLQLRTNPRGWGPEGLAPPVQGGLRHLKPLGADVSKVWNPRSVVG